MPASRIFFFARTSRCPIVAGETRNAEPIAAASKPRIVCRISGARTPGVERRVRAREHQRESLVGELGVVARGGVELVREQREMVRRAFAGAAAPLGVDPLAPRHGQEPRFGVARHAVRGQSTSADANASASASSAPATSRVRAASSATSLP